MCVVKILFSGHMILWSQTASVPESKSYGTCINSLYTHYLYTLCLILSHGTCINSLYTLYVQDVALHDN